MNEKGDVPDTSGSTVPEPLCLMVTAVAEPPKVLSLTVTASVPQAVPEVLLNVRVGGFSHLT